MRQIETSKIQPSGSVFYNHPGAEDVYFVEVTSGTGVTGVNEGTMPLPNDERDH